MKCIVFLLSTFMLIAIADAQDVESFRLSGAFEKFPNSSFRIQLDYDPANQLEGSFVAQGETDSLGKFDAQFEISEGLVFVLMFNHKIYRLWAEPGKDLGLLETKVGIECSGSTSVENQFLFDSQLADPSSSRTTKKFDATDCLSTADALAKTRMQQLEKVSGTFGKDSRFYTYAHAQVFGVCATQKNTRSLLAIRNKEISKTDLPENYYDFWNSFPILDDSAAMLSRRYQGALDGKFQYLAEQKLIEQGIVPADDPVLWSKETMKMQGELLTAQPNTDEMMFASQMMLMIQYMPPKGTRKAISVFAKKFPSSKYLATINTAFAKSRNIDLAAISAACKFRDAKGDDVTFSDLQDKVIYIDFWGLWCKGCMDQQPNFEKLVEKFAGNDQVVFLSLNFFDSQEDWAKFLDQKRPKGVHWRPATESDETKAEELFLLSSFPRFMIFGKAGKLVTASAPVPDHVGLEKMLNDLTKQ